MAEVAPGPVGGDRRLILIATIGIVFVFIFSFLMWRSCAMRPPGKEYIVIYSNLDLKEAASIVTQLKELKIPYELREQGRSIAIPRDKADEVRLELAAKGLPAGGVVGWEIFDEEKLGATDFDRRISLIRAISGELSRTIRRIEEVEDARVQIVIPETRLFEVAKAPVTASVLLTLRPGAKLAPERVKGIIHLVASSVEGLMPENVTVVDIYGNILSAEALMEKVPEELPVVKKPPEAPPKPPPTVEVVERIVEKVVEKPKVLTPEEKELLRLKAKQELEKQLASRTQLLLNQFYPSNTAIVRVNVELGPPRGKIKKNPEIQSVSVENIQRITVIILVDNRFELTPEIKKSTFATVAAAVGYDRDRGDKIILRKVPFRYIQRIPERKEELTSAIGERLKRFFSTAGLGFSTVVATFGKFVQEQKAVVTGFGIFILFIILIILVRRRRRGRFVPPPEERVPPKKAAPPLEAGVAKEVERIRDMAEEEPEKVADLLKRWLQGGG